MFSIQHNLFFLFGLVISGVAVFYFPWLNSDPLKDTDTVLEVIIGILSLYVLAIGSVGFTSYKYRKVANDSENATRAIFIKQYFLSYYLFVGITCYWLFF